MWSQRVYVPGAPDSAFWQRLFCLAAASLAAWLGVGFCTKSAAANRTAALSSQVFLPPFLASSPLLVSNESHCQMGWSFSLAFDSPPPVTMLRVQSTDNSSSGVDEDIHKHQNKNSWVFKRRHSNVLTRGTRKRPSEHQRYSQLMALVRAQQPVFTRKHISHPWDRHTRCAKSMWCSGGAFSGRVF